jgi:uncharacterized membrane protein
MNFPDALLSPIWASGAFLCFLPVLIWSVATAPWVRLTDSAQSNVWLGAIVFLALVWNMKAGVKPGLNLHLLGATMFTLMFGRQLAIIGLASVLAAVTLNVWFSGVSGWQAYALNALVLVVVPVFVSAQRQACWPPAWPQLQCCGWREPILLLFCGNTICHTSCC